MKKIYLPEGMGSPFYESQSLKRCLHFLEEALQKQYILEGKAILCDREHNLHIDFGMIEGIIPRKNCAIGIEEGVVRDIAILSRVNKTVSFYVEEILMNSENKPYAVLNRRKVQENCRKEYLDDLVPGDIIDAVVTRLEPFGAFCDVGAGIPALLPIDNICVSRIPHPNARFFVGQKIKTVLKSIAPDGKLTLSHKELLGTWLENVEHFSVGETVPGIVRSIENYGVFIELLPNLAGLAEYTNTVKIGESATVYIKNICPSKMKIKLILIDHAPQIAEHTDYPYPKLNHIDAWYYSPIDAQKQIFSVF